MKILLLSIRSLFRFRLYTTINIVGLALSLACVIVISRYVYSETMTDRFIENSERVYLTFEESDNGYPACFRGVWNPNNEKTFKDITEHPAIECKTFFYLIQDDNLRKGEEEIKSRTIIADSNFFKIATYPLLAGTLDLKRPDGAIVTREFARKLFGDQPAIGKQLLSSPGKEVTITGIIGEASTATSFPFDIVLSDQLVPHWMVMPISLVRLHPNADYKQINKQYSDFMFMVVQNFGIRYQLFPMQKVYFQEGILNFTFRQGKSLYINLMCGVAGIILLIGIFNFINIYSVIILRREREIGMKKVFGAQAHHLFMQLWTENLFLFLFTLLLGWTFVEITNPLIINLLGSQTVYNRTFDWMLSGCILFVLPTLTTLYAFFKFYYKAPIQSLQAVGKNGHSIVSRKIFLTCQYIATMALIVCSLFFIKQLNFMLNKESGLYTRDVLKTQFFKESNNATISDREEWEKQRARTEQLVDVVKQKLDASPLIKEWTYGNSPVAGSSQGTTFILQNGEKQKLAVLFVSKSWLDLFAVQQTEGKSWKNAEEELGYEIYLSESAKRTCMITNTLMAWVQPENRLWWRYDTDANSNPPFKVVGSFQDFNMNHLATQAMPLAIVISSSWRENSLLVSLVPERKAEAIRFLKELHDETVGGNFEYTFIEDDYKALYRSDKEIATIYSIFTIIAIIISSLGLFSLSLFDIQQRYSEIAIRKINGATTAAIIELLLQKYYKLIAIAFLIATPAAWLFIYKYLENFAYKTPISGWMFVVALLLTAGISLLTLIWQIRRAARMNPVKAIKSE